MKDEMRLIKPPKIPKESRVLANHELVVVAAFLAGAQHASVDTEDVAVKASELAPGRFAWRKYKDQINIDAVRKRLWDAAKPEKGGLLIGSEKTGWRLTKAGFVLATRTIYINLEHPRIAMELKSTQSQTPTDDPNFQRMAYEIAFTEYAIVLAQELSTVQYFFDPQDALVELRQTLDELSKAFALVWRPNAT